MTDTSAQPRDTYGASVWWTAWAWFLGRNLLGWVLILGSFFVGLIPGPGGIFVFLLGLALITLPGKRQAIAHGLRGRPINPRSVIYRGLVIATAVIAPAAIIGYLHLKWRVLENASPSMVALAIAGYAATVVVLGLAGWFSGPLVNRVLAKLPTARRKVRPWMRRHGIVLLPPRRRRRYIRRTPLFADTEDGDESQEDGRLKDEAILQIHEHQRTRMQAFWQRVRTPLRKVLGVVVTAAIFVWILKPIVAQWGNVKPRIAEMNWWPVVAASIVFATYLLLFRALVWRRLLKNFGHKLPVWPVVRIWSTSELARYLPGSVWQVVGRVYLIKPYGVRGSVCSTSQIMELALYLLANLVVALGALTFLGWKSFEGLAKIWMIVAAVLVPLLSLTLHPGVFYSLADTVLAKLKKPPIRKRMSWKSLVEVLGWNVLGLAVQGFAIYMVVEQLLELPPAKWWVVTGAYCLAWCAGFLAFWAPGGLGVREAVFIAAMDFAIPHAIRNGTLQDPEQRRLFLIFLSVLLRIWATFGELLLTSLAYTIDWRGAIRRGRGFSPVSSQVDSLTQASSS